MCKIFFNISIDGKLLKERIVTLIKKLIRKERCVRKSKNFIMSIIDISPNECV